MILDDLYRHNALSYRDHPAIIYGERTITYGEYYSRSKRLANALAAGGLKRTDRIAILSQNCPEYVELHGASGISGFIAVGINYRLAAPEQAQILTDCEPAVFVFESEYADRAAELRAYLPKNTRLICIEAAPGDAKKFGAESYDAILMAAADTAPALRANEDDIVFLIYTSGTTGRPKGVMLHNSGQLEQARLQATVSGAQQIDRMLIVMPFYHIGGTTELLTYFSVGATIVLHRAFDAKVILESVQKHRVTSAHLAPTMIQMMLEVQEKTPIDVSSLHTVCYASAPMSVALSRRANAVFGKIFMQIYGMSEGGAATALLKHQHHLEGTPKETGRLASAGQPMFGSEIRVVRPDGTDCDIGEIGEVWGRSKFLMKGYWRNPEATQAAIGDTWMHTGDMGYFDEDHYLFIADRKKDMIISGGENIYSREVEETLLLHPAVAEAAVIGVPDPKWGESVKAFVSFKPGASATEAELIEHCRASIASYKKPKSVEVMPALPRILSTNKIDKKKMREPFWVGRDRQVL